MSVAAAPRPRAAREREKRRPAPAAPAADKRREEEAAPQSPESLRIATFAPALRPTPPPPAAPPPGGSPPPANGPSAPPSPPSAPPAGPPSPSGSPGAPPRGGSPGSSIARPAISMSPRVLRRACASCGGRRAEDEQPRIDLSYVVRRCPACGGALARGEGAPAGCTCETGRAADLVADTVRSGGQPLQPETRTFFEARLGHDLGGVRVHTGDRADRSARAVDALAYTVGSDVVFRAGYFAPGTPPGQRLLAHELAHVVQQDRGGARHLATASAGALEIGRADDPLEREADHAARAALAPEGTARPALSADRGPRVRRWGLGFLEDAWDATAGAVSDAAGWVGGKVVEGAEWVGEKAGEAWEWAKDQLARVVEALAPGLLDFLRGDVLALIKGKVAGAFASLFGGLAARVAREGVAGALTSLLSEAATGIASAAEGLGGAACDIVLSIASAVGGFIKSFTGPLWDGLKTAAGAVADFFSGMWEKLGKPALEAIQQVVGAAWDWIVDTATWLWDLTAPIRDTVAAAWDWLMDKFGLAWNTAGSVLDWLKEKAIAAWDTIMEWIRPILGPLKVIGGILLLLSPLGPVVAIGAGGYALYRGLKWLWENWSDLSIVVTARKYLSETLLPAVMEGLTWLKEKLGEAMAWLSSTLGSLVQALGSLMEALGVNWLLSGLASLVGSVRGFFVDVAGWIAETLAPVVEQVGSALAALAKFLRPILELTAKLVFIASNPWLWPMVLTGWAWRILPDCIKGPVIDWVLDVMIWAVNALPDFQGLGEWWPKGRAKILDALVSAKAMSMEAKIRASDRVAKIMTLEDLGWLWSMIDAARKAPGEFEGQVEEELLGVDLTKALPFERSHAPTAADVAALAGPAAADLLPPDDAAVLQRPHLTDNDVKVDAVAPLDLDPELVATLGMQEGDTREFGENPDPAASLAAIRAELSAPGGGQAAAPAEGEAEAGPAGPPLSPAEETERQLQAMMDQPGPQSCDADPKQAENASKSSAEVPESAKIGPLTRGQRGRYLLNQMWKGIKQWFSCNAKWLIPTLIVAAIALIALEIFTGGAVTAALPVIMEVMGVIFIGVAVVRGAAYVAEYVAKAVQGDTAGAAKALARAVAIAVVELVFALMFEVGRIIKAAKNAALSAVKGAAKVAKTAGRGVVRTVEAAGHALAGTRAGRAFVRGAEFLATATRRTAGAVLREGKIVMKGVGESIGRGVRSLEDLARRLWQRVRFRRFRLRFEGRWFVLEGYINPWVILASGRIREWHGPRTELAEPVLHRGRVGYIVGIVDEGGAAASAYVRSLENLSEYELRDLYRQLRSAATDAARRELVLGARLTGENAKELRKAMTAAGKVAAAGDHAHHIVPSTHRLGQAARDVLEDLKIGVNSSHNGVFVSDVIHSPLHTKRYMQEVERLVLLASNSATTKAARKAAVEKALDAIAARIRAGKFP